MPMEDFILAVYNLNRLFSFNSTVSLNDFYKCLSIEEIVSGDALWLVILGNERRRTYSLD